MCHFDTLCDAHSVPEACGGKKSVPCGTVREKLPELPGWIWINGLFCGKNKKKAVLLVFEVDETVFWCDIIRLSSEK